jgi:hypothetical protein
MTTQAAHANSLTTLERILIQQSESLNHQLELMKSITSNKSNESSVTISTTLSSPTSVKTKSHNPTDMEGVSSSPQTTLKRSRRLSAIEPLDMVDVTYHPELNNYTSKQRNALFTFLDNKDEFDLKQTLTYGYNIQTNTAPTTGRQTTLEYIGAAARMMKTPA